jgi:D-glycero-D-manno-heptose 1,7-bisphosphate phosphatase
MSRRAAFLDRDGTINIKAPEAEYVTSPEQFEFLPGAEEAVRMLDAAGWLVVVVSNQRGVALGRMTLDQVGRINDRMSHLPIAGVYVCPHERGACDCRKPATGLFEQARADFPEIEFARSVMIGDAESDMLAGQAIGASTFLVGEPPRPSLLDVARRLTSAGDS